MRATVVPVKGRTHPAFDPVEQGWDPDESAGHAGHKALNPSCAACVVATGAFKLKAEPKPDADAPEEG